ncbi:phosphoribosyl-ATP pyrophosphohydrolase [Marinicrinis lubricantis]|uniref:Phosphoribosyl-ATP pyrophosphohydrolase n=1 Tax=Marinicrinis lubricantis TaxID=2086470 RepID=A0ABW1IPL6_9BACL
MPVYNKLVRDLIPEVIQSNGKNCRTKILNTEEYINELNIKLNEEIEEYHKAINDQSALEELADILEVIRALAEAKGTSWQELENIRARKADSRGVFKDRVFLIDVDDA